MHNFALHVKNVHKVIVTIVYNHFIQKRNNPKCDFYYPCHVQKFLLISTFCNGIGKQLSEESCGRSRQGRPSRSARVHSSHNTTAA
jgi:hypothetical protein